MKYVLAFLSISLVVWGIMGVYYHTRDAAPLIVAGLGGLVVLYLIMRKPKMGE